MLGRRKKTEQLSTQLSTRMLHSFIGLALTALIKARARQHGANPVLVWAPTETWIYARFVDEAARVQAFSPARFSAKALVRAVFDLRCTMQFWSAT